MSSRINWSPPRKFKDFIERAEEYIYQPLYPEILNLSKDNLYTYPGLPTYIPIFELFRRGYINGAKFGELMKNLVKEIKHMNRSFIDEWFLDCCQDYLGSPYTMAEALKEIKKKKLNSPVSLNDLLDLRDDQGRLILGDPDKFWGDNVNDFPESWEEQMPEILKIREEEKKKREKI